MQPMYPGMVNSPQTELASAITDTDTTIPLLDASVLPDPPNICTIGTGEDAETVLYTGISGNDLTGVTRGFQGAAKAWSAGVKVARNFTAYDYDALRQNVADHASATTGVHGATSTVTANSIVQRDSAGRAKFAAPSASDDAARKQEVDAVQTNLNNHIAATTGVHGATSAATPNTIVQRDVNAQAKFGIPTDNAHAATKEYVDGFFEEGTWTPTLAGATTPGDHTYSEQRGYYTRIGNVVVATFRIQLSAKDTNMAGNVSISGLPFVARNASGYRAGGAIAAVSNITLSPAHTQYVLQLLPNSTQILIQTAGGGQPQANISPANITDSTVIAGTIVYHTD